MKQQNTIDKNGEESYICESPGVSLEILKRAIANRPPNEDRIRGVS